MKRIIIGIIVLALAAFAVDKFFFSKKPAADSSMAPPLPLSASKNSKVLNESLERLLDSYAALKEALADYDTARANKAAALLGGYAGSLTTNEIKGDSTGDIRKTAEAFAGTIGSSARQLTAEPGLEKKKRAFSTISEALYNLVRTVRYDRRKLYYQHCPMAFNDTEEAWWISSSSKIENPYLGRKHPKYKASMEGCGDITDSLDFSK